MYTYLVNKAGILKHFDVPVQQECKGKHGVYLLLLQCHYGRVLIILIFYITREKQRDPQGACIDITTVILKFGTLKKKRCF